ncbi:MAG: hypothetical protein JSS49_13255 [Planctomycetes bacterium]|nr:hypothetical protein [Planctomycetota bacterium]
MSRFLFAFVAALIVWSPLGRTAQAVDLLVEDVSDTPFDQARARDESAWKKLLVDRDFSRLEAIATDLQKTNAKYRDGRSRLWRFYACFGEFPHGSTRESDFQARIVLVEAWLKQIPNTIAGRTVLSHLWTEYAAFTRSNPSANDTDETILEKLDARCNRASELLDEVERASPRKDVGVFRLRIDQSRILGRKPDPALVHAMHQIDPLNREVVSAMAYSLMPRSVGAPGDLENFADDVVKRTAKSCGQFHYAVIGILVEEFEWEFAFYSHQLDWLRLRQGLIDLETLFPKSREHLDPFARLAIFAKDFPAARKLMQRIGNSPNPLIWSPQTFPVWKEHLMPDLFEGEQKQLIVAHYQTIRMLEVTANGKAVMSFDDSPALTVHDLGTGKLVAANPMMKVDAASAAAHGGKGLLTVGTEEVPGIHLMRLSDGRTGTILNTAPVKLTRISQDGAIAALATETGEVSFVDIKAGKPTRIISVATPTPIHDMQFSPDGNLLATVCDTGLVRILGARAERAPQAFSIGKSNLRSVAWSPAGDVLAVGDDNGNIDLIQWPERKLLRSWQNRQTSVETLAFSPDARRLAIGLCSPERNARVTNPLRIWNLQANDPPQPLRGHKLGVTQVRFTPDGSQLVSASDDWTIRTWDLKGSAAKR